MPRMYRQFWLRDGETFAVVWLEDDARLKIGARLTCKETGDRLWTVTQRYTPHVPFHQVLDNRHWKVGGLQ